MLIQLPIEQFLLNKPFPKDVYDFNNKIRKSTARYRLGNEIQWASINPGDWILTIPDGRKIVISDKNIDTTNRLSKQ